ncbi:MAG: hypothetical protein E7174_01020 [Firmicutes bacterium]|nr:hypothetical protein [Bacillota bacterium]
MNTKGFTLIEFVAIILILAAIFLVSFPTLLNITSVDEEKKYTDMVDNLCLAGENYIYANMDDFKEKFTVGNEIEIVIEELIIYGNVDNDLINPKTNEKVDKDKLIYGVLSDNSLVCEYVES